LRGGKERLKRFGFGCASSHSRARVTRWSCRSASDSAGGAAAAAAGGGAAAAAAGGGAAAAAGGGAAAAGGGAAAAAGDGAQLAAGAALTSKGGVKGLYKDVMLPLGCPASRDEGELVSLGEVTGEVTWGEVGPPRGEAGPRFLFWRASTSAIEVPREDWRRCAEPLAGVSAEDDEPAGEGSPSWSLLGSAP